MYVCQSSAVASNLTSPLQSDSSPACLLTLLFFFFTTYPRRILPPRFLRQIAPRVSDILHLSTWTVIEYDITGPSPVAMTRIAMSLGKVLNIMKNTLKKIINFGQLWISSVKGKIGKFFPLPLHAISRSSKWFDLDLRCLLSYIL